MTENVPPLSQCLRGLHFIEAWIIGQRFQRTCCRSFFGNCTSLRLLHHWSPSALKTVVVPSGTALH